MAAAVENWDDDLDFNGQGDLFAQSVSTVQTSMSSRMSVNSESNVYDEDWKVQMSGNDDVSVTRAIQSAKSAGVPLPLNVPPSALVGGSIKRLGKKNTRPKLDSIDDWGDDLDLDPAKAGGLVLTPNKPKDVPQKLQAPDIKDESDDFDLDELDSDWAEGSLGIRFAGTRKDTDARNRSPSTSAMSPSLASQTAESEDDDLRGLEIPDGPVDLQNLLKNRQDTDALRLPSAKHPVLEHPTAHVAGKSATFLEKDDDFFNDLDVGGGELLDNKRLTLHKNVKQKTSHSNLNTLARNPTTTLTFTLEKPTTSGAQTRIPRPVPMAKPQPAPSRLAPVMEQGAVTQVTRSRPQAVITHAQLLRSKRSMPVLKSQYPAPPQKSHALPTGSHANRSSAYHQRRESDPHRSNSPPAHRSLSRLSNAYIPDTPSRTSRRPDRAAPKELAREAASKKTLTKPQRRRLFGDGTELDAFDDLPTSAAKESKFVKAPSLRGPRAIRSIPSRLNLRERMSDPKLSDKMGTPITAPFTPRSPQKQFQEHSNTPSYLRDTAASRIARESRLAHGMHQKPRGDGPLMPVTTNWKAQVAARSPHASPSAQRNKGRRAQPGLIRPGEHAVAKNDLKGMTYNATTQQWEGNENVLGVFDFPIPAPAPTPTPAMASMTRHAPALMLPRPQPAPVSPPRPALIAPMSAGTTQNVQVVGGMVFDPARMCWLKFKPQHADQGQTRKMTGAKTETDAGDDEDEDDPFADIEDLKDAHAPQQGPGGEGKAPGGLASDEWLVGEEFDLGPEFIKRQRDEEVNWRKRCQAWYPGPLEEPTYRPTCHDWRWTIREIAGVSVQ